MGGSEPETRAGPPALFVHLSQFVAGSARAARSPGHSRMAPVDPVQHVGKLRRRDCDRPPPAPTARRSARAPAAWRRATSPRRRGQRIFKRSPRRPRKTKEIARVRVPAQGLLDLQGQRVHAATHVRHARGQPHPHIATDRDHRAASAMRTRESAEASTPASTTTRAPQPSSIVIRPAPIGGDGAEATGPSATTAHWKPVRRRPTDRPR